MFSKIMAERKNGKAGKCYTTLEKDVFDESNWHYIHIFKYVVYFMFTGT